MKRMCKYHIHVFTHLQTSLGQLNTDMRRLTTGILSEFSRCANVYLHKSRQYSIVYYTSRLHGIAYCS